MSELKATIRQDLTTAMKARDKLSTSALRMLLSAIQAEETSGARLELEDATVLKVIAREIKKRRESAEVYSENGRQELAETELAEAKVFEQYQPTQLDDTELETLAQESVKEAADGTEVSMKLMGQAMKIATEKAGGRADGKRLSAAVRAALQG